MTSGNDDEKRLVNAIIRRQDDRAFTTLYERHSTYLYRFALRLTAGDDDVAQDLVHDTWLRAVQRLHHFEWRSTLRTWLSGFVVSLWRERHREADRQVPFDEVHAGDPEPWREPLNRVDVERALTSLAPGFREVLVLHDVEGYTHEDIGLMLGIKPGTSKSQLARARAAMRRALGESPQTEQP